VEAKGKHPGQPGPCNRNRHGNAFERTAEGLPSAPPHPRQAEGGGVMSEETRRYALSAAMELSDRLTGFTAASEVISMAKEIEDYLVGRGASPLFESQDGLESIDQVSRSGRSEPKVGSSLSYVPNSLSISGKIYRLAHSHIHNAVCSLTVTYNEVREDDGGFTGSDLVNTGSDISQGSVGANFAHSSSSSVVADGESGDSVAADPRNDATPDTPRKESGTMLDFVSIAFAALSFSVLVRAHFAGRVA